MTATASGFDPAKLPRALRPWSEIAAPEAAPRPELQAAGRFEDGQICGPFGPRFAGFGPLARLPLRQRFASTAAIAGAIAAVAALMQCSSTATKLAGLIIGLHG